MFKNTKKRKAAVLFLGLAALMVPSTTLMAQYDGNGGDAGGNYGINIGTMGEDPPEPPAPLGSGLFIMAAAGAAYAFSRKRKKQENN